MRKFLFILVGVLGLAAAICIIFVTVAHFIYFIIAKNVFMAILMAILWVIEIGVANYLVGDYHGE